MYKKKAILKNTYLSLKIVLIKSISLLSQSAFSQCIMPTFVTAVPNQLCAPGGTTNLNATSGIGTSIAWYTVSAGGNAIGNSLSGADYNVYASSTTTFYAEAYLISSNTLTLYYTGAVQIFTATVSGSHTFQAWGGKGGNDTQPGAFGGYASGVLALNAGQTVAVFVGGQGSTSYNGSGGGWNGGGNAGPLPFSGGGGGGSDVRLGGTALINRVLVAGGGGGGGNYQSAGAGGGLSGDGFTGNSLSAGSQTAGGIGGNGNGSFGQGGNHTADGGGGGGGYYGGSAGNGDIGGGGGSSYIGGVNNGITIAGSLSMPNPSGGTMTGNGGNGIVRIIYPYYSCVSNFRSEVVVDVSPNPNITVNSGSICAGQSFSILPSGASTYTVQGGSFLVSPTSSTSYTVSGTSSSGCVSQSIAISNITVQANPIVSISGTNKTCSGSSVTLTAFGANTYTWNTGIISHSIIVTPTANLTLNVIGKDSLGCIANKVYSYIVLAPDSLDMFNNLICYKSHASLLAV